MAKLIQAGHTAYLVGGGVRDILMGKSPKDFDVATSAKPEEVKKLFSNCLLIGRRFRLAHIRFGKKIIEVSTFRAGDANDSELIIRDNSFGTPEEDVLRRDFTINGLFYDPHENCIIDYVGGVEDLNKQLIRTIGNPYLRFKQDPVRMLRLLKFQARLGFHVCSEARAALIECKEEILKSSPARVLEEFLRMLESGFSKTFFDILKEYAFLDLLIPRLTINQEVQTYLEALDKYLCHDKHNLPDRSILIAALLFPLIAPQISAECNALKIQTTIQDFFHELFSSAFFPIPRRLRSTAEFIIQSQFKLTPFNGKKPVRFKLARHPEFALALKFLHLRSHLQPSIEPIYHLWKVKSHHKSKKHPSKLHENPKS